MQSNNTTAESGYITFRSSIRFKKIENLQFLNNMHSILPWQNIVSLVESNYLESSLGRSLIQVESMVRIYFIQLWFELSDSEIEETLLVCEAVRHFALLKQGRDLIPGKTEVMEFRELVEKQNFQTFFSEIILTHIHQSQTNSC